MQKARQTGEDVWLAVLTWRNTATTGFSTSPVQRLFGLRTVQFHCTSCTQTHTVDSNMCRFSKLLLFSFFFCKDGSDRLMKRASFSCCNFLCVVLAAAYLKYRRCRLSCLPFVWHFFHCDTPARPHAQTHTYTHTHTYTRIHTL